jgi:nitrite reductase/ring-hydroxylating ferredoxin subunit
MEAQLAAKQQLIRVAKLEDVHKARCLTAVVEGHTLALFAQGERVYAIDNRCPHMGFPLQRGTVKDGILTCHWHHARFDLASGGTFDQFADDVRSFPVQIRDGEVWVDLALREDPRVHQRQRLRDGLEQEISLVIAKAVISLLESGNGVTEAFRIGLDFGVRYRQRGWGPGLTIHTCMHNLLPHLDHQERPRAAYHGLSAVARDCAGMPPRFGLQPLPGSAPDMATLKRWFRQFVEVRDAEGTERCLVSAVRSGARPEQLSDMLFAAATDHRYIDIGHVADFTNKALEALDRTAWKDAEPVLTSLVTGYTDAARMEESNAWRHPVDLITLLESAFESLPTALESGAKCRGTWQGRDDMTSVLLGEDPAAIVDALLAALRGGCSEEELAARVAYSAALRIARFHTSNEFTDWDTALHTFTFANAIHQGVKRSPSPELLRGVFDAAMSVYLDRFLNVPAAGLPKPAGPVKDTDVLLHELAALLDKQQQVNEAGEVVARYLNGGGQPARLLGTLGRLLLREDRDFHTIQVVEAAFRQHARYHGTPAGVPVLLAAARYLAAHAPTVRAQGQTYQIAFRLHRGERVFED